VKKEKRDFLYILIGTGLVSLVVVSLLIFIVAKRWKRQKERETLDGYKTLLGDADDAGNDGVNVGKKTSFFEMQT